MSYRNGQLLVTAEPATGGGGGGGNSLSVNGSTGYMSAASSTSLNITGAVTLEAWIKTSTTGSYQNIISRESWSQSGTGGGYQLSLTNLGKIRLDLYRRRDARQVFDLPYQLLKNPRWSITPIGVGDPINT